MLSALILALALAAAEPAEPVATPPTWRTPPTIDQMARHYPKAASDTGIEGEATLLCTVEVTGRLVDCRVQSESPVGYGFGEGALAMAPTLALKPGAINGRPVATPDARLTIRFVSPYAKAPMPDMTGSLACYGLLTAHAKANPKDKVVRGAVRAAERRVRFLAAFTPWTEADIVARLAASRSEGLIARQAGTSDFRCIQHFGE